MAYTLKLDYFTNDLIYTKKSSGTSSAAVVRFVGTNGTVIPIGTQVQDSVYSEKWLTTEDGTISAHTDEQTNETVYYVELNCSSSNRGKFEVEPGKIDILVSSVTGVTSVTNKQASVPGTYGLCKFNYISGGEEVCQRVRVALQHQFSEYFLNRLGGIPYYTKNENQIKILGSKNSDQLICNLLRKKLLDVPGVLQVKSPSITKMGRNYYFSCSILVETNGQQNSSSEYEITNIQIGA